MRNFNLTHLKHALLALLLSFIAGNAWSETYKKVTDAASLTAGDKILFVCESRNAAAGSFNTNYLSMESALISDNSITNLNGALEFTLGGTTDEWTFTDPDGNIIGCTAAKKLALGNGTTTWKIEITDGNAIITNGTASYGTLQYNATSPRFCTYTSNQTAIQLYKKEEGNTPSVQVDAPTFSPAAGEVEAGTKVTLTQASAAIIMYTLDGTTPSYKNTVGELYSNPIEITKDVTIKAIAVDDNDNESEVATATYTLKQAAISGLSIDFESSPENYSDWTFTNIAQANKLTPKAGSYYGNTNGKTTASIQTKNKVAIPGTFTCFLSKESTNTKANVWKVSVSADGENWTEVGKNDGSSITNTTWTEFSVDLSAYSDVYVKLSYEGTAAIRAVDEISISTSAAPAAVAAPTFSLAEGTYTEAQNVTITAEDGATIYYTLDGTNPTEESTVYKSAIAIEKTTTVKAIAVKGGESSKVTSATYTIEEPAQIFKTMAELQAAMTATKTPATVKIQGWIVTGVAGNQFYMTDGNGYGMLGYQSGHDFAVGDQLDGTVEVNIQLYNSQPEIMNLTSTTTGLTVTEGQTAAAAETAIADITVAKQGAPVTLKGVVYNETAGTFTDKSSNAIVLYDKFNVGYDAPTDGWTYDVTGVVVYNKTTAQISPVAADGIVFVSKPTNYVDAPTASVDEGAYETPITVELESAGGYDIFYTLDGTEPDDVNGTQYENAITIEKTTTLKAIAVDDDGNYSPVATFVYTIAAPYTTIAAINADAAAGNTPVKVRMSGWKVIGVNGNQYYLTDGTDKGIVCYQKNHGFKLHDELNGTVECNLTLFNGLPEITELTSETAGLTVTADAPATPYEVASIANLTKENQGALVTLKGVKFDGTNFVDATGDIQPYNQFRLGDYADPKENYYYDVTGVVIAYYNKSADTYTMEIAPQEADQFAAAKKDVNVKVSAAGWATFVADADVAMPAGVTAYYVTGADENVLQLEEVKDVVPANTPVALKADAAVNETVQGHLAEKAAAPKKGMLVGTYADTMAPTGAYVLQQLDGVVAFYIVEQTLTVTAGHAYLTTDEPMGTVKAFTFDRTTGIEMSQQAPSHTENAIYDLSGRRVEQMTKGLYIVNGKKVLK